MTTYARPAGRSLEYPEGAEFVGIINWWTNDTALRGAGYMPLVGTPEPREGYEAEPSEWEVVEQSERRVEPRQVVPGGIEMVDREITVDTSYILVEAWQYTPTPTPPEPEPDPEPEPIDWEDDDFATLPSTFTKWELIQAWEALGDIDNLLNSASGKNNLLTAWASLPDHIDLADILTKWAAQVALYAGGRTVNRENIIKWLQYIKDHREAQQ